MEASHQAVAVGDGSIQQFFTSLMQGVALSGLLEGSAEEGGMVPCHSLTSVADGEFRTIGRMIAHAITHCGIGLPLFSATVYAFLVEGMEAVMASSLKPGDLSGVDVDPPVLSLVQQVRVPIMRFGGLRLYMYMRTYVVST